MGSFCSRRTTQVETFSAEHERNPTVADHQHRAGAKSFEHVQFSTFERKLMNQFLPDFVCDKPSTFQDLAIVTHHWDQLHLLEEDSCSVQAPFTTTMNEEPPIVVFFDSFYRALFQLVPQTKPMFRASLQRQGQALMHILQGIKSLLLRDDVLDHAAQIAHKHMQNGVKCEFYNPVGLALMQSLDLVAPQLWTEQVETAWKAVFCHVSLLVLAPLYKELQRKRFRKQVALRDLDADAVRSDTTTTDTSNSRSQNSSRRSSGSDKRWGDLFAHSSTKSNNKIAKDLPPAGMPAKPALPVKYVAGSIASRRLEMMKHTKLLREERHEKSCSVSPNNNDAECPYSGRKLTEMSAYQPCLSEYKLPAVFVPGPSIPEHVAKACPMQQEDSNNNNNNAPTLVEQY